MHSDKILTLQRDIGISTIHTQSPSKYLYFHEYTCYIPLHC